MKRIKILPLPAALPAVIGLLSLILLSLGGCTDLFRAPESGPGAGKGLVRVSVGSPRARTFMPVDLDNPDLYYTLKFTARGKDPVEAAIPAGSFSTEVELEPGTWSLEIKGYEDEEDAEPLMEGAKTGIEVSAGGDIPVEIELKPAGTGDGTLAYRAEFPDTVIAATLTVSAVSGDFSPRTIDLLTEGEVTSDTGTTISSDDIEVPPGYYRIAVELTKPDGILAQSDIAHIYTGRETLADYSFAAGDFTPAAVSAATTLAGALASISNPATGASYVFVLDAGTESMAPATLNYPGTNVTISIDGQGRTVNLSSSGSLLTIGSGVTLKLRNIELAGLSSNTTSLIRVESGGTFILQNNAVVKDNTASADSSGGGVYVAGSGTFTMKDSATVSGNRASSSSASTISTANFGSTVYGGGVYVYSGGTFTMEGTAAVKDNTAIAASSSYSRYAYSYGGGVYVTGGTFIMEGSAAVSGNTASSSITLSGTAYYSYSYGGGVYVDSSGTFTMESSAAVCDNGAYASSSGSASRRSYGGGVYVDSGTFTMKDSVEVSGNTVSSSSYSSGGGVYVASGTFIMEGSAAVSGNLAYDTGGGVYAASGTFTMEGSAAVSGNTAEYYGGGVYVANGTFTMEGSAAASGNLAYDTGGGVYVGNGEYVGNGTFTMKDSAAVSGNTATGSSSTDGGGVYVDSNGTFTMKDSAAVSGNTANSIADNSTTNHAYSLGGGVYVARSGSNSAAGTFTMEDSATVSGNTASSAYTSAYTSWYEEYVAYSLGGGVYVASSGTFTMKDSAAVSGNRAYASSSDYDPSKPASSPYAGGGGVYSWGTFTMEGSAAISGNTAVVSSSSSSPYAYGGGVYIGGYGTAGGTLIKKGGTIYGDTDTAHTEGSAENTAASGKGHAVFVGNEDAADAIRNATAGPGLKLYARFSSGWTYNGAAVTGIGEDTTDKWEKQ